MFVPSHLIKGHFAIAKCAYCGTFILFGGERDGSRRYCNAACRQAGFNVVVAEHVPQQELAEQLKIPIHAFDCIIADECHHGYATVQVSTWRSVLEALATILIVTSFELNIRN